MTQLHDMLRIVTLESGLRPSGRRARHPEAIAAALGERPSMIMRARGSLLPRAKVIVKRRCIASSRGRSSRCLTPCGRDSMLFARRSKR
jgi:hypothetical protein